MQPYLDLLRHVLHHGERREDRTGVGTLAVFGAQSRYDLRRGFPLLTTKKLHLRSIIVELLWFLRGDTNVKYLNERGVTIWDEWADEKGDLGRVYGAQWTDWRTADAAGQWLPVGDRNTAVRRIDELKETRSGQPVTSALTVAYQLLAKVDQETEATDPLPKLVVVLTDRTVASWDQARTDDLKKFRETVPDPKPVHVILDFGVDSPANVGILSAEMKPQVIAANQTGPDRSRRRQRGESRSGCRLRTRRSARVPGWDWPA